MLIAVLAPRAALEVSVSQEQPVTKVVRWSEITVRWAMSAWADVATLILFVENFHIVYKNVNLMRTARMAAAHTAIAHRATCAKEEKLMETVVTLTSNVVVEYVLRIQIEKVSKKRL